MAKFGMAGQTGGMNPPSLPTGPARTILVADDHAGFRRTLRDFLPADAGVVECSDGGEAVLAYETHHPAWTVMDIEMPGMDGLTATRAIRAAHPEARIIIVTSHDTPDCRTEAKEAGATAFVPKDELASLIGLLSPF